MFFDDFEVLSKERADSNEVGEIKRMVSSLLLHMDNLNPNVILIAATNHSQLLDSAVWRRFDICLSLNNPQIEQQQQWLAQFGQNVGFDFNLYKSQMLSHTKGCSFAELEKLLLSIWRKFVIRGKSGDINAIIEQAIAQTYNCHPPQSKRHQPNPTNHLVVR